MKEIFDQHYRFYGDLITPTSTLENIICELTLNTFDTKKMEVKVTPTQGSMLFIFQAIKQNDPISIKSKGIRDEIILNVGMPSFELNSKTGHTGYFVVYECTFITRHKEPLVFNKIHCSANIPHSAIFERERSFTSHYSKGLLAGWKEKKNNNENIESWEKEEYSYKTDCGYLNIIPSFVFGELPIEENKMKAKILIDQIYLSLSIRRNKPINFDIEKKFLKNINDFLKVLSFLEGEILEWRSVIIDHTNCGKLLKEKKIFREAKDIFDMDKNKNHYRFNRKTYHKIIYSLFVSLQKLDIDTYNEVNRIIDRLLIASTQKTIDTQLIYWHSCLDTIIKYFKITGPTFSHRLIDCCNKNCIDWLDLFPNITIESLNDNNQFLINIVRNKMLHEGIYPDDYRPIFRELYKIRALCERLICRMLNVDYTNTGVGIPQY